MLWWKQSNHCSLNPFERLFFTRHCQKLFCYLLYLYLFTHFTINMFHLTVYQLNLPCLELLLSCAFALISSFWFRFLYLSAVGHFVTFVYSINKVILVMISVIVMFNVQKSPRLYVCKNCIFIMSPSAEWKYWSFEQHQSNPRLQWGSVFHLIPMSTNAKSDWHKASTNTESTSKLACIVSSLLLTIPRLIVG